jgi:hypothetical protein
MDNVIRPTFGSRAPRSGSSAGSGPGSNPDSGPGARAEPPVPVESRPLRLLGQAGGYQVGLIEDADGPEGPVLKVVLGHASGAVVEAVAVMPPTPEGAVDAEMVGLAVLRALEIVGEDRGPGIA